MHAPLPSDMFATRVYVVGEVLVSLVVLVGGFVLVYFSEDQSVQLVGSGAISAATVFWFQRRTSEQSNNSLAHLANGKLSQVLEQTNRQQERTEQLALMVARSQPREHA